MSPFFQFFQTLRIGKRYHINRCNLFGLGLAPRVWTEFFSLVLWLAERRLVSASLFTRILCWMDDTYGADIKREPIWYEKFQCFMPPAQHCLLSLWDELGIPHHRAKHESGFKLKITGFTVDSVAFTFALPVDSKQSFIVTLRSFVNTLRPTLGTWLHIIGYTNWTLNVLPWGRPALSPCYAKTRGKQNTRQRVFVNNAVKDHLSWLANRLESSTCY